MNKISIIDRIILLLTGHVAGYQIISGMEGYGVWTTLYFTIAFGILVISCLLLILFGFEILNNIMVVVVATLIPLNMSLGIISNFFVEYHLIYLVFAVFGISGTLLSRLYMTGKAPTIILASVHGIAGLLIFFLPLYLSFNGTTKLSYSFVAAGGALIGVVGLLLVFLKIGKPILSKELIYKIFPTLLLIVTICFVIGFTGD